MQLIQHVTVESGGAASITFSGIPQTFTDLVLVTSLRSSTTNSDIGLRLNGSASNFTNRYLFGNGSSAASGSAIGNYVGTTSKSSDTANTFGNLSIYFPNYRSSQNKSISSDSVQENNGTAAWQVISSVLWSQTAAISSIELYSVFGGNLVENATASLYGITAGSSGGVTVS